MRFAFADDLAGAIVELQLPALLAAIRQLDSANPDIGGAALDRAVDNILEAFSERPFIFNLGHGVLPQTPIAHVERMLARVRAR